ncbi:MAG TPA: glycosyltransferase family 2 protein [Candidatus Bipolaricaulota bacterium]|nr:glycosyltransferase family 2 protein [Candidatus Bipolaricaulota bacterium]
MSKVSINLVTWNGAKYIQACLKSVFEQTFKDFSLLIIDNGSTDDTLELIGEKFPHLKIVRHKENQGFAKAHNQAIHWSKSDYVLVLNQDIILEPDFLENIVALMDKNPRAAAASGKLLRWQNNQKTNYIDTLGLKIYKNHRVVDLGSGEVDQGQYDGVKEVFGASGAAPVFRREALNDAVENGQYFDEDFFSYKEDVDLAYRLRWRGWQAWRVPSAVGYHDRSVSGPAGKMNRRLIMKARKSKSRFGTFYSYRNHLYVLLKNAPKLGLSIFFYELQKFLYILFAEQSSLKAFSEAMKNRKKFLEKRKLIMERKTDDAKEIEKWFV